MYVYICVYIFIIYMCVYIHNKIFIHIHVERANINIKVFKYIIYMYVRRICVLLPHTATYSCVYEITYVCMYMYVYTCTRTCLPRNPSQKPRRRKWRIRTNHFKASFLQNPKPETAHTCTHTHLPAEKDHAQNTEGEDKNAEKDHHSRTCGQHLRVLWKKKNEILNK